MDKEVKTLVKITLLEVGNFYYGINVTNDNLGVHVLHWHF